MTSIDKLQIRGIRSFSPIDGGQILQFQKPLTLIVGKNGSGKTTIIECLKMGCTGDLPPNCKNGQAFIHDPKILSVQEVKAQIKLKFFGLTAQPVVCTRSFSLTQKATKMEYKAFEASLQTVDSSGARQCLSYKCADLNRLVPELMGVSPAVLESVIFVHQEDSCWPLSDDATLKKKFDDIFAATQYTKALEEIRKFKNVKKQEEKSLGLELATLEEQLGTANKLREERAAAEETSRQLNELIASRKRDVNSCQAKLPGLHRVAQERNRIRGETGVLETKLHEANEAYGDKKQQLQQVYKSELADASEELEQTMHSCAAHLNKVEAQIREKEKELTWHERHKEEDQQKMYAANSRYEAAKAQRNQHAAAEQEAEKLLGALEGKHGMLLGASADTTQRASTALNKLKSLCKAHTDTLAKAKTKAHEQLSALMAKTQETKVQVEGTGAEIDKKHREAKELQRKEINLGEKLGEMEGDEIRVTRLRTEVARLRTDHETQTQEGGGRTEIEQLRNDKSKLSGLHHQFNDLVEEYAKADAEHDKKQAYEKLQQTAVEQRAKLQQAIEDKRTKLQRVLGGGTDLWQLLEENLLSKKFNEARRTREAERESQAKQVEGAQAKLSRKESEAFGVTEKINRHDRDQEELEEQVRRSDPLWLSEGFDFAARIAEAEREAEEARNAGAADEDRLVAQFIGKVIYHAQSHGKCHVCNQRAGEEQIEHMRKKQKKCEEKCAVSPEERKARSQQKSELVRKLHHADDIMKKLKKLRTIERPALDQELQERRTEQNALRGELENEKRGLEEREAREREVQDLRSDVEMLGVWNMEYLKSKRDVESQSAMQSAMLTSTRSKAEVSEDMQRVTQEREQLQRKVTRGEDELRRREGEIHELLQKKNASELELSKLQAQLERKHELTEQRRELGERRAALQEEAKRLRQAEQPQRSELGRLESELTDKREMTDREVARHDEVLAEANRDLAQLQMSSDSLQKYAQAGHAATLAEAQAQFEQAQRAVRDAEEQLGKVRECIESLRKGQHSKEGIKLEIQANLEYRRLKVKVDELRAAIQAKTEEAAALPNADGVDREIREIEKSVSKFNLEIAQANGSLDAVRNRLRATDKDLRQDKYRKVDDEHRKKLIECKTTHFAVKDLDNYYKALDRALMKFHSSKMESINKSIKELWNKTYKGPDIDGIEIHSEHEGETATGARKQSYRVIMTKGDTRLDMRGRCSAGQKVLASLVIRLALAESFCLNCGILALDEPTTNLDTANIESFASAINDIIKARKQQANFQLIVITHDEEFVQMIGRTDNCSHFFRVDKRLSDNSNLNAAPHSVIDKFEIGRFG